MLNCALSTISCRHCSAPSGSQVATSSSKVAREARILANFAGAGGKIRLRYIVDNATWQPSYNVRVEGARDKVTVEYLASIQQLSGEDWNNVQMTLSTATPSLVAKAPVLNELAISLGWPDAICAAPSTSSHKSNKAAVPPRPARIFASNSRPSSRSADRSEPTSALQ